MRIKPLLKQAFWPLCAAGFAALAWGVSLLIPASARLTRWERAVEGLSPSAPTAEVCAVAVHHFGVRLTAEDVSAWRMLCQQGHSEADALRITVSYRRARSE